MVTTVSSKGLMALIVSEGMVDTWYLDNAEPPVPTVGIGHTKAAGDPDPKVFRGKKLTVEKMLEIFAKDKVKYEDIINKYVKVELSQQRFDALFHFVYNVGEGNFRRSKLLLWLNQGDYISAGSKGFHGWLRPKSLKGRRDKERDMFMKGIYGSTKAPFYTANMEGRPIRVGMVELLPYFANNPKEGK